MSRELSDSAVQQKKTKTFLSVGEHKVSYGDQLTRLTALGRWLEENNISVGERILVGVDIELEQASLLAALLTLGRVPIIIDPNSTRHESAQVLEKCSVSAVIATKTIYENWDLLDVAPKWLQVAGTKQSQGVFAGLLKKREPPLRPEAWPLLASNQVDNKLELPQTNPHDTAYIIFTSGTTSSPKGVEVSRDAMTSQLVALVAQYGMSAESRIQNTLPMHHVDGFIQGPVLAWFAGASLYRPVAFRIDNIQKYLDAVYRDRITHLIAVPTMLALIQRLGQSSKDCFQTADFQVLVSVAGHLETALWTEFENLFSVRVTNMYGLSETCTSALFSGPDDHSYRLGTLGIPVNCEVKIVADDGREVAVGQIGELCIAGPQLMKGYFADSVQTDAVMQEGWLLTGDLVQETETGHFEIKGRKKNLIINGGRNISPEEITAVLNQADGVLESVTFGVPDEDWGERVVSLIVSDSQSTTKAELMSFCRNHLSDYKIPADILFVPELEKGPSGKILLSRARELYAQIERAHQASSKDQVALDAIVRRLAAEAFRTSVEQIPRDATPENTVGWDSLGHMNLVLSIEDYFNIRLTATEIMSLNSLELLNAICARSSVKE